MKNRIFCFRWCLAVVPLLATLSLPARADLIFSIESITASPGTSSAFDVLLTNTGASAITLAGFSFGITTADTDITFTEADISTTVDPYIFSVDSLFGPIISTSVGQTLQASDLSAASGDSIAPGDTVGIGHILFSVAGGGTPELALVTLEAFPTTSLSDPTGANLDFTAGSGTIDVTGTPTPEPRTLGLLLPGLIGFAIALRRRGWQQ